MSLQHLILGLLKYAPMSGYDLNKAFQASVQHFWNTEQSLIYRALYKMADLGWVEYEQQIQDHLPNKKLYRLTEAGRAEFRRWLATPQSSLSFHEAWLGQLFFGAELSTDQLRTLLEARIASLRETLDVYENQVPDSASAYADAFDAPRDRRYWMLTLEYGIHRLRGDLQWAEDALRQLDDMAGENTHDDH
ncbi:MAG: PadR family transcriptional regulator [Caldilineaceae bacterium]|nr:PadR family transcriptional regulator [Caldilineaceae bacterium]